jgi:hypothetical protein
MMRVMILDVDGNLRDFSARRDVRSTFYDRSDPEGGYLISDHTGQYRVTLKAFDDAEKVELAAILEAGIKPKPTHEEWIETGRYAGVELGELPDCSAKNFQRVLGGAARASEKYFGHEDDFFGTRR